MENVSADYVLKPSFLRMFLGDLAIFLFAYLLSILARTADPLRLPSDQVDDLLVILAAGILGSLLLGGLDREKMMLRLANGRVEGRAPLSWKPIGFALARLDRQRTLASLKEKAAYLWSVDGEKIAIKPKAFEPREVEEFIRLLGL